MTGIINTNKTATKAYLLMKLREGDSAFPVINISESVLGFCNCSGTTDILSFVDEMSGILSFSVVVSEDDVVGGKGKNLNFFRCDSSILS